MNAIPLRELGKTGAKVSAIGMGGHHLGNPKSYDECERIVHEAIDAGVTFFDNCWEYHNGRAEDWAGRAITSSGKRKNLFLMTKVCTHGRAASMALQMLDESLRRMRTDYLDLWQIHGVSFDNDPELAMAKGGSSRRSTRRSAPGRCGSSGSRGTGIRASTSRCSLWATRSTPSRCRSIATTRPGARSSSASCPRRTSAASRSSE